MGDNSRMESVRVVILVHDIPTLSSTTWSSIMKIFQRVIELWPAQDFITVGGNSRMESVRVIILLRDTPTQGLLHIGEVS